MRTKILAMLAAAMIAGCHPGLNASTGSGGSGLATLVTPKPLPTAPAAVVDGHDRSGWPARTVVLPVGRVEHPPRYGTWADGSLTATADDAYPTAASALEHARAGHPLDAVGRTLAGLGGLVTLPIELLVSPPSRVERSPLTTYERLPWPGDGPPPERWYAPRPDAGTEPRP